VGAADTVITNALDRPDHWGIVKADVAIRKA